VTGDGQKRIVLAQRQITLVSLYRLSQQYRRSHASSAASPSHFRHLGLGLRMFARLSRMLGGDAFCGNDVPLFGV
jgi:hypothetical protein